MGNSIVSARWRGLDAIAPEKAEEAIFLSLFGGLVYYLNGHTVVLSVQPSHSIEILVRCGLLLLAFRKVYRFGHESKGRRLLLPALLSVGFFCCFSSTQYEFLLDLGLCVFCAMDVPYRRILRVWLAVTIVCFFACVSGSFMDLLTSLSYRSNRDGVNWRHSFGVCYPTDFAAYLAYMLLALWACERRPHPFRMLILTAAALILQLKLTDTRCSEIVCILLIPCICYAVLAERFSDRPWMHAIERIVNTGLSVAMPLMAFVMIAATALYTQGEPFWDKLNSLLSNRLQLGKNAIENYNFSLFGTAFDMVGNGGSLEHAAGVVYNFVDSSYILLPVRYGIAALFSLLIIYARVVRRATAHGYRRLSLAFFLVGVASLIEHHVLELAYNPFILLALADFGPEKNDSEAVPMRKEKILRNAVWLLLAGLLAIVLPRLWSYGKTAVNVLVKGKEAARIVPAQYVLYLLAFALCVLVWGLYQLLAKRSLRSNRRKVLLLMLAALLFVTCVGGCTEYLLKKNMYRYTERLEKSEALVEAIRDADLSCSIRVADIPELYLREMEDVQNQLMPAYTASTEADVVIFSDAAVEHEKYLLWSGYTRYQVTEKCVAYTNCADAAEILLENGCTLIP